MNYANMFLKSAGPLAMPKTQRVRGSLRPKKIKLLPTPIVVDRGKRQPKTKRSRRRNKVRAWQRAARAKFQNQEAPGDGN